MSKKSFRTLTAVTLVVCMLFAVCGVAFAESRMVTTTSSSFVRDSATKGTATLAAHTSNNVNPSVVSRMTLQEAPLGTTSFTNSNVAQKTKSSTRSSITHVATFDITTSKEYRVKMEIIESINGDTITTVLYENLQ